jgi:hypothetical protein
LILLNFQTGTPHALTGPSAGHPTVLKDLQGHRAIPRLSRNGDPQAELFTGD